ncbi:hypothetical protein SAMN05192563_1004270 [Paraburkholderia aspalathi]|uniref:Uncharacterized protein n=1 Tax=Paraburkholderia aspalathi TaxID=1324617 RepID=A0A1I7B8C1_9BURK|nr:hypothetical protein SAMN05192563_1004270 [Paraburkholderia aspalathi]
MVLPDRNGPRYYTTNEVDSVIVSKVLASIVNQRILSRTAWPHNNHKSAAMIQIYHVAVHSLKAKRERTTKSAPLCACSNKVRASSV